MSRLLLVVIGLACCLAGAELCRRDIYKKIGCFKRQHALLPDLIVNDRDVTHRNFSGITINWNKTEEYLHDLACRCSKKATGHYDYFSIGFYGECWAGTDMVLYEKIIKSNNERSNKCVTGDNLGKCSDVAQEECTGGANVEYIYLLTTSNATNYCIGKKNGNYADPKTCAGYITCSNEMIYHMPCPSGLHYHPDVDRCEKPEYRNCTETGFCFGKADGDYADSKKCTGFITCTNGLTYRRLCPSGLHFSATTGVCQKPENAGCQSGQTTTTAPDTTLSTSTMLRETTGVPVTTAAPDTTLETTLPANSFCTGKKDGNYADPKTCAGYITCSNEMIYHMPCPSGLHYHPDVDRCEKPEYRNCTETGICFGKADGDYADSKKCTGFITCTNGLTYNRLCPSGLHFNPTARVCQKPENAGCQNMKTTTSAPDTTPRVMISTSPPNTPPPASPCHWMYGKGIGGSNVFTGSIGTASDCLAECRKMKTSVPDINGVTVPSYTSNKFRCRCEMRMTKRNKNKKWISCMFE